MTLLSSPSGVRRFTVALALSLTFSGSLLVAQDPLGRAKDFYASADYEQALQILSQLQGKGPATTEISALQVFCLVALGKNDDAKKAIEAMVRVDPLYHPSEAQASPRVRSFYEGVRRPLLPDLVRQTYAGGKDAFDRKQMPVAATAFDRVIAMLDDMKDGDDQGVADLRTLASGFRDLAKAATPTPPPPTPSPAPAAPAADTPAKDASAASPTSTRPATPAVQKTIFGPADKDVRAPIPVTLSTPPWRPENAIEAKMEYEGSLELLIGEDGSVISASLVKSVQPRYDPGLLQAAKSWKFQPAMRNGKPVKFRLPYSVQLHKMAGR